MPTTDAVPVPDEARAFLDSRRRSRARRAHAARTKWRRAVRSRAAIGVLALSVLGGGVATAEQAAPSAPHVLKKGSRGTTVKALQRALGIQADGVYGPATRRAVRRFQRASGLTVDGIAGPATLAALGIAPAREAKAVSGKRLLDAIARCESGGNPRAVSPDGRYRGKYQFSRATWRALGGKGDPARAPEAEQDRRAAALLAAEGTKPWPHCGARARR